MSRKYFFHIEYKHCFYIISKYYYYVYKPEGDQGPLLLAWINFNPSMDR